MAELSLYVDLERVHEVREFVSRIGEELALDSQVIFELQLAVEEACSNVVFHGYDGQGGNLEVSIEPEDGGVRVVLRDWGAAFDPEAVRTPDVQAPLDQRPLGGLGLHIMRQMMDQVEFQFHADEGNTLTLVKHCERGNGKRK
jgi:serine/threonine-protein kinase RsbW